MKLNNYKGADCGGGERVVACWVPRSRFEDLDYAEPMRIRAGMGRLLLMHGGIINIYISRDGHTGKGINVRVVGFSTAL